jgi:hypothetical protein
MLWSLLQVNTDLRFSSGNILPLQKYCRSMFDCFTTINAKIFPVSLYTKWFTKKIFVRRSVNADLINYLRTPPPFRNIKRTTWLKVCSKRPFCDNIRERKKNGISSNDCFSVICWYTRHSVWFGNNFSPTREVRIKAEFLDFRNGKVSRRAIKVQFTGN